jgi:hypothetical protein
LAVHDTVIVPVPVPDARSTEIHGAAAEAVHAHEAAEAVTVTAVDPCVAVAS